jgi:hypothetical protein
MDKKTGSQARANVLGVDVELIADALISKRDAQRVLQHKLGVTDRQARASVSSYRAEGWLLPEGRLNDPLTDVRSFVPRVLDQADRRYDARVENLSGQPRKI